MNRFLILDYCRRWLVLYIALGYGGTAVLASFSSGETILFPMMSSISFVLYCFYFFMDVYFHNTLRFHRCLPVRKETCSKTLWFEGFLIPLLMGLTVYLPGAVIVQLTSGFNAGISDRLPQCLIAWILLGSCFFISFALVRGKHISSFWAVLLTVLEVTLGICIVSTISAWYQYPVLQSVLCGAAAILAFVSYRCASWLTDLHPGIAIPQASIAISGFRCQDMSIGWFDRFHARPFLSVTISSFFPILTAVFLLRNESLIYQYAGAVVSLIAVVSAFFLFLLVFVIRWGALLGSMQFFIMLPLSRNKIVAALVALPVFSFSPIALLPLVGIDLSYSVCWIVLSLALLNNAVHLKWGPVAAVFTLNLIGVLAGLSFAIQDYPDLSRLIFDHHLDWAFALGIIVGSVVWIHYLIHKSNAPYRHKPTFGAFS